MTEYYCEKHGDKPWVLEIYDLQTNTLMWKTCGECLGKIDCGLRRKEEPKLLTFMESFEEMCLGKDVINPGSAVPIYLWHGNFYFDDLDSGGNNKRILYMITKNDLRRSDWRVVE